jgi:hypothetical protein
MPDKKAPEINHENAENEEEDGHRSQSEIHVDVAVDADEEELDCEVDADCCDYEEAPLANCLFRTMSIHIAQTISRPHSDQNYIQKKERDIR